MRCSYLKSAHRHSEHKMHSSWLCARRNSQRVRSRECISCQIRGAYNHYLVFSHCSCCTSIFTMISRSQFVYSRRQAKKQSQYKNAHRARACTLSYKSFSHIIIEVLIFIYLSFVRLLLYNKHLIDV